MFKMCWERLDPRFASHIQFQYYQIKKLLSTPRFSFFFQKKLKISIKNNNKKQNLLSERIVVERKMNRCRFVLSLLMWASLLGLIVLCFLFSPFSPSFNIIHYRIQGPKCQDQDFVQGLSNMVSKACSQLNRANVPYWLMDGTLLGAMNGGDLLPTDRDGDIGYLWEDHKRVKAFTGSMFIIKKRGGGRGTVDLKRYEISDGSINRVNAPHENSIADFFIAKYNSGIDEDDIFPLRTLGGNGTFAHCQIPANAEKILEEMFGEFKPSGCPPLPRQPEGPFRAPGFTRFLRNQPPLSQSDPPFNSTRLTLFTTVRRNDRAFPSSSS